MSFLVNDDELTLEAALAFIDNCGDAEAAVKASASPRSAAWHGSATSSGSSITTGSSSEDDTRLQQSATTQRRKPAPSTQQQRRRKQEIVSLREEVVELEAHLSQLQRRQGSRLRQSDDSARNVTKGPTRSSTELSKKRKPDSKLMDTAILQYRQRQRAELTNRKLKAIWENQSKLNEQIQHLLKKRATFEGLDMVFEQPRMYKSPSSAYVEANVMTELEKLMLGLYLESETVFRPSPQGPLCISSSTETSYEPGVGAYIDLRTTTPLACRFDEGGAIMWNECNGSTRKYPGKTYEVRPASDVNSTEKNFLWTLLEDERRVELNGLQYARKYEEPNRVVIVRSGLIMLPTVGVKFRERIWFVITPSPAHPESECVVRTCYRVYTEPEEGFRFSPGDLTKFRNFISKTLVGGMRMFVQQTQNLLLEESGRFIAQRKTVQAAY